MLMISFLPTEELKIPFIEFCFKFCQLRYADLLL